MQYWLIKSEAECYSIDDIRHDKKAAWTGIRNYQARNFMRDMQIGDLCLFYHSNGTAEAPTGVYGIVKVASKLHADKTQFDKNDDHYDPKAKEDAPIWECVDMAFVKKFAHPVSLGDIKRDKTLDGMEVRRTGSRLSVQPVSEKHFLYTTNVLAK
jgi:predicted RNA-binding protein with PUA-like domain